MSEVIDSKVVTDNLIKSNVEKLLQLFPECASEGNVDFEKLKEILSEDAIQHKIVDGDVERYEFVWPGKSAAMYEATLPIGAALRPKKEESKDWDTTGNVYIEGDNLQALKLLRKNYAGKIKMIYIDPPYNTGKDFVYKDHFTLSREALAKKSGNLDPDGRKYEYERNEESNPRYHSDWCSMMYSRLKIARDLLRDDGVLFISIDDNEVANLRKLCDEIFGENNRIGLLSVLNNLKGRSDDKFFATCNEYMLVYARSVERIVIDGFEIEEEELDTDYDLTDEISAYKLIGFRKTGKGWEREARPYMFYPVLEKDGDFSTVANEEYQKLYVNNTFDDEWVESLRNKYSALGYNFILPTTENNEYGRWRWGRDKFLANKDIDLALNGAGTLCTKMRATIEDGSVRVKTAKTLWYKPEYDNGTASKILKRLFNTTRDLFENPKSPVLMEDLLKVASSDKSALILDFFSGSATTAHAVMQLNAEDGGNRKFIMVQLQEECEEGSEAAKAGYKTICEIGEERIRRAGEKIKSENATIAPNLDIGFRVFEVAKSPLADLAMTPQETEQDLLGLGHIDPNASALDLLYHAMTMNGIASLSDDENGNARFYLSEKVEEREICGSKILDVADGAVLAALDKDNKVNIELLKGIAKLSPSYAFFRDDTFAGRDDVRMGLKQVFDQLSPTTKVIVL